MSQSGPSRRAFLAGCAGGLAATSCAGGPHSDGAGTAGAGLAGGAAYDPRGARRALRSPAPMLPPAQAVLLSVRGAEGGVDEVSVVWSSVVNGDPPQVAISVAHEHVAGDRVAAAGEFVLNVPVASMAAAFDEVDMSSREVADKFARSGLTRGRATQIDAPTVAESPIQVECRVEQTIDVPPARRMFIARVVATTVLSGVCDDDEMLLVDAVPFFGMTAGSGEFYTMGQRVGHIGHTKGVPAGKYRY